MAEPVAPSKKPRWGDSGGTITEPPEAKKDLGWVVEKPAFEFMNWLQNLGYQWIVWLQAKMSLFPGYAADVNLAISSNNVTPTQGNHTFTADGTVKNVLQTNLNDGRLLLLHGKAGQTVTLKDSQTGAGQMILGKDIVLSAAGHYVLLQRVGTDWVLVSGSSSFSLPLGANIFFDGLSACPAGFAENTEMRGRIPMGVNPAGDATINAEAINSSITAATRQDPSVTANIGYGRMYDQNGNLIKSESENFDGVGADNRQLVEVASGAIGDNQAVGVYLPTRTGRWCKVV